MPGLLRSARLVLAPTLLTNAMVAWCAVLDGCPIGKEWGVYSLIVLTGLCFFLMGMWMNDWVDAEWDKENRPDKPLPQGMVRRKSLADACILALVAGNCFLSYFAHLTGNMPISMGLGGVLIFLIVFYNWIHKRSWASVIIMGLCRSVWCLVAGVLAFFTIHGYSQIQRDEEFSFSFPGSALLISYAVSLGIYTMIASLVARGESKSQARKKWAGILLSSMCLHDMIWLIIITASWEMPVFSLICYGVTLLLKRSGQAVS